MFFSSQVEKPNYVVDYLYIKRSGEMNLKDFTLDDERSVVGRYKSLGLTDPDAIYNHKKTIQNGLKALNIGIFLCLCVGFFPAAGLIALMVFAGHFHFGLFAFTLLFLVPAIFFIRTKSKKTKILNNATAKYCQEIGVEAV